MFCFEAGSLLYAETNPELSPHVRRLNWKLVPLTHCSGNDPKTPCRTVSSPLYTFPAQKVHIFLWEENECDPGRADSSGRALNMALLVRPHTAHSVSSGRSGRSSLEIIKALISCQTPQRHPSITQTLKPPSWMLISWGMRTGRWTNSFCTLHSNISLFGRILSGSSWKTADSHGLFGQMHCSTGQDFKRMHRMLSCSCYTCKTSGSLHRSCVLHQIIRCKVEWIKQKHLSKGIKVLKDGL